MLNGTMDEVFRTITMNASFNRSSNDENYTERCTISLIFFIPIKRQNQNSEIAISFWHSKNSLYLTMWHLCMYKLDYMFSALCLPLANQTQRRWFPSQSFISYMLYAFVLISILYSFDWLAIHVWSRLNSERICLDVGDNNRPIE